MKLFEVTNGWMGETYLKVFVVAENKERAIELGRVKYKREAEKETNYDESYYLNLEAECLCEEISKEWTSEVRDG